VQTRSKKEKRKQNDRGEKAEASMGDP